MNVYLIQNTNGDFTFRLLPGEVNGGAGAETKDTDLRLHGHGVNKWGEAVNENFYRLLENFSCPEKTTGDWHAGRGLFNFDPAADGIVPKSEEDPRDDGAGWTGGPGYGISNPVRGQLWFNSTRGLIYYYSGTSWSWIGTATGIAAGAAQLGDLLPTSTGDLLVYRQFSWPVEAHDRSNRTWSFNLVESVASLFAQTGSPLEFIGDDHITVSGNGVADGIYTLVSTLEIPIVYAPSGAPGQTASPNCAVGFVITVNETWSIGAPQGVGTVTYNTWVPVDYNSIPRNGARGMLADLNMCGNSIINTDWPQARHDVANKEYVDYQVYLLEQDAIADYVNVVGDIMTGTLHMTNRGDVNFSTSTGKVIMGTGDIESHYGGAITLRRGNIIIQSNVDTDTTAAVLKFRNSSGTDVMILGRGHGNVNYGPSIYFNSTGSIVSNGGTVSLIGNANPTGTPHPLRVYRGGTGTVNSATELFYIEHNGTLRTAVADYETIIGDDDDIPNIRWVRDHHLGLRDLTMQALEAAQAPNTSFTFNMNVTISGSSKVIIVDWDPWISQYMGEETLTADNFDIAGQCYLTTFTPTVYNGKYAEFMCKEIQRIGTTIVFEMGPFIASTLATYPITEGVISITGQQV